MPPSGRRVGPELGRERPPDKVCGGALDAGGRPKLWLTTLRKCHLQAVASVPNLAVNDRRIRFAAVRLMRVGQRRRWPRPFNRSLSSPSAVAMRALPDCVTTSPPPLEALWHGQRRRWPRPFNRSLSSPSAVAMRALPDCVTTSPGDSRVLAGMNVKRLGRGGRRQGPDPVREPGRRCEFLSFWLDGDSRVLAGMNVKRLGRGGRRQGPDPVREPGRRWADRLPTRSRHGLAAPAERRHTGRAAPPAPGRQASAGSHCAQADRLPTRSRHGLAAPAERRHTGRAAPPAPGRQAP